MSEDNKFITGGAPVAEPNDWTYNEWLCRPDFAPLSELLMLKATMKPGHCHPFHRHPHREEILYIISGRAEQWVGEDCRILEPGDVALIRAGEVHATYNPFDEPLVFHAILSPGALASPLDEAPDPEDVSDQDPWKSLRDGMTPCTILADEG